MFYKIKLIVGIVVITLYAVFIIQAAFLTEPNKAQKDACAQTCAPSGLIPKVVGNSAFFWQHRAACHCETVTEKLDRDGGVL